MKSLKIHFSNVNFSSSTGPNSFASRLANELVKKGHSIIPSPSTDIDVFLAFIEPASQPPPGARFIQRLDGIWFKPEQFHSHNKLIKWAYENSDHVIWQSEFDKNMTFKHWGSQPGSVIRNGISPGKKKIVQKELLEIRSKYKKVFVCSASWHRQKRLKENVELFLNQKETYPSSCLIVMGANPDYYLQHPDIFYTGKVPHDICLQVYAMSDWMIHLAWLDHCPNVVVEALSQGCPIICSSSGGTKELVKDSGIIIEEDIPYEYQLCDYDDPTPITFKNLELKDIVVENRSDLDIESVAKMYLSKMRK